MKNLKINTLDGSTGHFDKEIGFAATALGRHASEDRFDLSAPPSRQALSSSPSGLTPHSARCSNRARQSQLIRAELPSNGYPQPSGSSKNARQWHFIRAERSSNGYLPEPSPSLPSRFFPFVILLRLATLALGLGVIGSFPTLGALRRHSSDVTDAGLACHLACLW